jgi:hypothetical protein
MALGSGTKLGPYEIAEPLGVGGMGEVYCARAARLKREIYLDYAASALKAIMFWEER